MRVALARIFTGVQKMNEKITKLSDILQNGCLSGLLDGKLTTFINGYSYIFLRNKKVLNEFDFIGLDGVTFKIIFSLIFFKVRRISFDMTSLAPLIFEACSINGYSLYCIGSTEKEITSFIKNIKQVYPGLKLAGFRNGYFDNDEEKDRFIKDLANIRPDILVVGMGTPFQEEFLLRMRSEGWSGSGFTCGGFIHQTANRINYYPNIIRKLGLRWMYRMYKEPKVIRRVIRDYPLGLFYFVRDLVTEKLP